MFSLLFNCFPIAIVIQTTQHCLQSETPKQNNLEIKALLTLQEYCLFTGYQMQIKIF